MPVLPTPEIIFETDDWLVINKPSGWHSASITPSTSDSMSGQSPDNDPLQMHSIQSWLVESGITNSSIPENGLLHRLDKPTSGCLAVARTAEAFARLAHLFRNGEGVQKQYLAAVQLGLPDHGEFALYFTSRYKRSKKVTVGTRGEQGHRGQCEWTIQSRRFTDHSDLVELELKGPGRRHQIRAGLAFLGHPVRGDSLYGDTIPWAGGFGLHAVRLTFEGHLVVATPPAIWNDEDQALSAVQS